MQNDIMTCKALAKWYTKEIEKAGMVILGVSKGHDFKAMMYRHGVKHLLKSLELKRSVVVSVDKRAELDIMINDTRILLQWIDTSFSEAIRRAMVEKEQYGMSPRQLSPINYALPAQMSPRSYALPAQGNVLQSLTAPLGQLPGIGSFPGSFPGVGL